MAVRLAHLVAPFGIGHSHQLNNHLLEHIHHKLSSTSCKRMGHGHMTSLWFVAFKCGDDGKTTSCICDVQTFVVFLEDTKLAMVKLGNNQNRWPVSCALMPKFKGYMEDMMNLTHSLLLMPDQWHIVSSFSIILRSC